MPLWLCVSLGPFGQAPGPVFSLVPAPPNVEMVMRKRYCEVVGLAAGLEGTCRSLVSRVLVAIRDCGFPAVVEVVAVVDYAVVVFHHRMFAPLVECTT
jgi:hypothetical protein